jgi:glycosyltransferase involved in cell wall biosynthesis
MKLSVVIPAYNSQNSLPPLMERLHPVLQELAEDFEIILVNDGSRDRTWEVIEHLTVEYPSITGFNLMRNYGQHNAILCGLKQTRNEIVVTMDDDLQHPPEEIPALLQELQRGFDVVYGTPKQARHSRWRAQGSLLTRAALQIAMGVKSARYASAFRAFRAEVLGGFMDYSGPFVSIDVLLSWGTDKFSHVFVEHRPREQGRSNYSLRQLAGLALTMVTGFSALPLKIASWLGFGFTLFGALVLVYVVGRVLLEGSPVPGFPFLASIIAIFAGVQLFSLGIIGEYLSRLYFRSMGKPSYVLRNRSGSSFARGEKPPTILDDR